MPIPPDSDPRKRRVLKAATAAARSGSSLMEESRGVAETPTANSTTDVSYESRTDVEGEERGQVQKFDSIEHQTNESRKHRWRRTKVTKTTVAVTVQESLDGIREKAMRIAKHR